MGATPPDLRGGVFQQALIDGGMNPMAVSAATSAAFHCATPRRWRGPTTLDYTSPQLRLVTPELRKFQFTNFDFQSSEGERRGPRGGEGGPEETAPDPTAIDEPRNPRPDTDAEQPEDGGGDGQYSAGRYIEIRGDTISVLASRVGVAILDSDRIVGGSIKVRSEWDLARFTEEGDFIDREWVLRVKPTEPVTVVTGLRVEDRELIVQTAKLDAWVSGTEEYPIPFERLEVVTEGELESGALNFKGSVMYYLGGPPEPPGVMFSIPVADCTSGP